MNRDEIARLCQVGPGSVTRWATLENLPVARGGGHGRMAEYLPSAVVAWVRARDRAQANPGGEAINPAVERAVKDRWHARILAQTYERRSDGVLAVEDVRRSWSQIVVAIRSRVLGMPSSLAPRLVGLTDPVAIERVLHDECYRALRELAAWQPPEETAPRRRP